MSVIVVRYTGRVLCVVCLGEGVTDLPPGPTYR